MLVYVLYFDRITFFLILINCKTYPTFLLVMYPYSPPNRDKLEGALLCLLNRCQALASCKTILHMKNENVDRSLNFRHNLIYFDWIIDVNKKKSNPWPVSYLLNLHLFRSKLMKDIVQYQEVLITSRWDEIIISSRKWNNYFINLNNSKLWSNR